MIKAITEKHLTQTIQKRPKNSYKGNYGRILLVGGEANMAGAITLAASAAVYSGAGLVTVASHPSNKTIILSRLLEAMFINYTDEQQLKQQIDMADVIVIGPGTSLNKDMLDLLNFVLKHVTKEQALIIDGGAITNFASGKCKTPDSYTIFTPHAMEWQRLSAIPIAEQSITNNQRESSNLQAYIVLKGSPTRVYAPNQQTVYENIPGTPAQATGGMGDTLAGMLAGFLGQFQNRENAILSAVYLHSYIAQHLAKENYVTLPSAIIQQLPRAMKYFEKLGQAHFV